jgi:choline dehydrogenase-like flavoprotein
MYLARGKVLGGCSSTNATLYMRGTSADYDKWGLKGWRGDDVLPWFKATEDNNNPALKGSRYHSTGTPADPSFLRFAARAAALLLVHCCLAPGLVHRQIADTALLQLIHARVRVRL